MSDATIDRLIAATGPPMELSPRVRTRLAMLIRRARSPREPHKWCSDCVSIDYEAWRWTFGRNTAAAAWAKAEVFERPTENYSKEAGVSLAYRLRGDVLERLAERERERDRGEVRTVILDADSNPVGRRFAAARRHPSRRRGVLLPVPNWCPVNVRALAATRDALAQWGDFLDRKAERPDALRVEVRALWDQLVLDADSASARERLRRHLQGAHGECVAFLDMASGQWPGCIPQTFLQSPAGRWYGAGLSLQSCRRVVRRAALYGCYQHDIDCCHHAIALHIAEAAGLPAENLRRYVENKKTVRADLAAAVGVPVERMKTALLAMIYGARRGPFGTLADTLTSGGLRRALREPIFAGLHDELRGVFRHLIDTAPRNRDGRIINALGLVDVLGGDDSRERQVAHLLQGIEAQALQAALTAHPAVTALHDGWVTRGPANGAEAERAVLAATGIPLRIETDRYTLTGIHCELERRQLKPAER